MKTQTIFDSWVTYPSIFINHPIKKSVVKPLVTVKEKKISINPIFLCPNKLHEISMINLLKCRFGMRVGKVNTFQTGFISTTNKTLYNGHELKLILDNDKVLLEIMDGKEPFISSSWDVKNIVYNLKQKNKKNHRLITKSYVINLIKEGKLQVKFNVNKTKDHGTMWKVF